MVYLLNYKNTNIFKENEMKNKKNMNVNAIVKYVQIFEPYNLCIDYSNNKLIDFYKYNRYLNRKTDGFILTLNKISLKKIYDNCTFINNSNDNYITTYQIKMFDLNNNKFEVDLDHNSVYQNNYEKVIMIDNIDKGTQIRYVEDYLKDNADLDPINSRLLSVFENCRYYRYSDNCHDFDMIVSFDKELDTQYKKITFEYLKNVIISILNKNNIPYTSDEILNDMLEEYDYENSIDISYIYVDEHIYTELISQNPDYKSICKYDYFKVAENEDKNGRFGLLGL